MGDEIVIAGAGVSGLTAAINLKRAGRSVRVLERHSVSGEQRFPDWDAVENWTSSEDLPRFLERIGIDDSRFHYSGRNLFTVVDPYGRRYDVRTGRPFFYLIKRGAVDGGLENGLQAQAEAMGIPIEYGRACSPGQAAIWAAGPLSRATEYVSVGFTFRTDHPDWVCGVVDKNLAPRAYAYLVVVDGEGTLAVLLSEARREANQLLERATRVFQQHADLDIRDRRKSGGSGGDIAAFWHSHRDFVIGEAAGFQDYLWGFGIRHAFASGYLAAQAIVNDKEWQRVVDREIRPLVHASLVNRWLYDRTPNRGYALLMRHFARHPDLHGLMRRWYHPRRLHRLLWPLVSRYFQRVVDARASHEQYSGRTRELPTQEIVR